MLLEALVACAGVTLVAVATALAIEIREGSVTAEGDLDFRGTLGVDKAAPVGFREIRLRFSRHGRSLGADRQAARAHGALLRRVPDPARPAADDPRAAVDAAAQPFVGAAGSSKSRAGARAKAAAARPSTPRNTKAATSERSRIAPTAG